MLRRLRGFISMALCLLMIMPLIPANADSVNVVLYDDAYAPGVSSSGWGFSAVENTRVTKVGSKALCYTINTGSGWPSGNLAYSSPVELPTENLDDLVLKMWIKLPKIKTIPMFYVYTKDSTGVMQTYLPLEYYIDTEDRDNWTYLQIPLSDVKPDNGRYSSGVFGKTNFKQFLGFGFKMDLSKLSEPYTFYLDDVMVTSDFNPSKNTKPLTSFGKDAVEAEPYNAKDGKLVYGTLFSDTVESGETVGTGSGWTYQRRYVSEGISALGIKLGTAATASAKVYSTQPIFIKKENLKKSAIEFDVKSDALNSLSFILMTHNKEGLESSVSIGLKNYNTGKTDARGFTKITIPFGDLPYSGTIYNAYTGTNTTKTLDWTKIVGFGLSAPMKNATNAIEAYIDNVRFVAYSPEITVKESTVKLLNEEEFNAYPQNFTMVDMKPYVNKHFRDEVAYDGKGGWIDQGNQDLRGFTLRGENKFLGIPFNIVDPDTNDGKGLLVMQGQNRASFPREVTIPVGKTAGGIYFLHSAAWIDVPEAGEYIVKYESGREVVIPITKNVEIADWGVKFQSEVAATAHMSWNENGQEGGFAVFGWKNTNPAEKIESITIKTPGDKVFIMLAGITLTDVSPAFISTVPETITYPEDVVNPDTSDWFPVNALPDTKKLMGSPLDVSWILDAPAGKHGFITADGENLKFEDGTPVQFWGANIVANQVFQSKENVDILVNRMAAAGYNLVRFHHMDANFIAENIFGKSGTRTTTREINPESLDKFEYFWAECKKRGMYIFVDPLCSRVATAQHDGIAANTGAGFKTGAVIDEELQVLQKEFATQLFTHVNPYTGTTLAEDPALVAIEVINEDSLFWGNAYSWGMGRADRKAELNRQFTEWLKEKYRTTDKLKEAWTEDGKSGLPEGESLETAVSVVSYFNLPGNVNMSAQRTTDMRYFVSVFIQRYYEEMLDFYRNELKLKCLITGSNAPTFPEVADLYANSAAGVDFIDQHYYFGGESNHYLTDGTTVSGTTGIMFVPDDGNGNIIDNAANRKLYNLPYFQSEWNATEPLFYATEAFPAMAAYSRLHNWNPIVFAFAQDMPSAPTMSIVFNVYEVPTKSAILPTCGLMFLRKDIAEAQTAYYTPVTREEAASTIDFDTKIPNELKRIAKTGLVMLDNEGEQSNVAASNEALLELSKEMSEKGELVSVTGEMRVKTHDSTLEINTARTQGYIGAVGGKTGTLDNMDVKVDNRRANVLLTSLSTDSIKDAEKLLLTTVSRWRYEGQVYSDDAKTMLAKGEPPMLVEPITGTVTIKTGGVYDVYCLDESGQRTQKATTRMLENGAMEITLSADYKCLNFELVRVGDSTNAVFEKQTWGDITVPVRYMGAQDMADADWARNAVNQLVHKGMIRLDENGNFNPSTEITTSELSVMWETIIGGVVPEEIKADCVTREMMLLAIARYLHNLNASVYPQGPENIFTDDAEITPALKEYLHAMVEMGMVKGDENGYLNPKKILTKAEAAQWLYNTMLNK